MANRLTDNPIYFDIFNADADLCTPDGGAFRVKKIRMLSAADGDDFKLENMEGDIIFHMSNNGGNADVVEVDFGDKGFNFNAMNKGVRIDVSDCTGMAGTDGTDAVWIYLV